MKYTELGICYVRRSGGANAQPEVARQKNKDLFKKVKGGKGKGLTGEKHMQG